VFVKRANVSLAAATMFAVCLTAETKRNAKDGLIYVWIAPGTHVMAVRPETASVSIGKNLRMP